MSSSLPQGQLPVTFYAAAPESECEPGEYVIGSFDAPDISAKPVLLTLDMNTGHLRMTAACGCATTLPVSAMLLGLLSMRADQQAEVRH